MFAYSLCQECDVHALTHVRGVDAYTFRHMLLTG